MVRLDHEVVSSDLDILHAAVAEDDWDHVGMLADCRSLLEDIAPRDSVDHHMLEYVAAVLQGYH